MRVKEFIVVLISALLVSYCSSSQQATDQSESDADSTDVYVFDTIEADTTVNEMNEALEEDTVPDEPAVSESTETAQPEETVQFFIVQVGAFSDEARANRFIEENKNKLEYELTAHFSNKVNLYVVQLPPFRTRAKAEEVRDKLWTITEFKDSFIVPK